MTSTPPHKRFKSVTPETPRPVIDDTMLAQQSVPGVFSQLDMPLPDGAMDNAAATEDETANNASVDSRLKSQKYGLNLAERSYRLTQRDCLDAIGVLASYLLPAIFSPSHDSLHDAYGRIIIKNPWLVHKLFDAYKSGEYHKIRRLGMCSSQIVRSPGLI